MTDWQLTLEVLCSLVHQAGSAIQLLADHFAEKAASF